MLSRVADNLYWMSRYLERAEHTARIIEVQLDLHTSQGSQAPISTAANGKSTWQCLQEALNSTQSIDEGSDVFSRIENLAFSKGNENSMRACISKARENARQARQQVPTPMFELLNTLYLEVKDKQFTTMWNAHSFELFIEVRRRMYLLQGIMDTTMSHDEEYHFIRLGRLIERISLTSNLLTQYFDDELSASTIGHDTAQYLHWISLLRSCAAFEPYLKVCREGIRADRIAEFLILDESFPKSIRFNVEQLQDTVEAIHHFSSSQRGSEVDRIVGKFEANLRFASINEIVSMGLLNYLGQVSADCDRLHHAIYSAYIFYRLDDLAAAYS